MKLNELKINAKTAYLYEGLTPKHKTSMMLWESAGRAIMEAELTADQITQLFQQIEKGATAAGGNRTLIGKGKDASTAVMKAYADLKSKVANSGPVKGIDAMYDQAAEKLKQATGGDQGVMQYVQKYRDFAKKHPVAQSLIYGALIAAAGVTGAGAGGAAALGLFKMVDKLLQGEKFSSAAYSGAKTGALAYGASKVGDMVRGQGDTTTTTQTYQSSTVGMQPASPWDIPDAWKQKYPVDQFVYKSDGMDYFEVFDQAGRKVANFDTSEMMENFALSESQISALFEHIVIAEGLFDKFKTAASSAVKTVGQKVKQGAQKVGQKIAQKAQTVGRNLTTKVTADKLQKAWKAAGSPTASAAIAKVLQSAGVNPQVIQGAFKAIGTDAAEIYKGDEPAVFTPSGNRGVDTQQPTGFTQPPPAPSNADLGNSMTADAMIQVDKLSPEQKKLILKQLDDLDAAEGTGGNGFGFNTQTGQAYTSQAERQAGEVENDKTVAAQDARYQAWKEKHPPRQQPEQPATTAQPPAPEQPATTAQPPADAKPTMKIVDPAYNPALAKKSSTGGEITPTPTGYVHKANPNNPNLQQPAQQTAPVQQTAQPQVTQKVKPEPISVGGQKINPNDPKYASLMKQLQQAKATA